METIKQSLLNITWDQLSKWAGGTILNRGKNYIHNVYELSRTENGGIIAWVSGTDEYATTVDSNTKGEIQYNCTCPYDWGPCKHAVALILAALENVQNGRTIPLINNQDELFLALFQDDDDFLDEDGPSPLKSSSKKSIQTSSDLKKFFQKKKKAELVEILVELADRHPAVKQKFIEDHQLAKGNIKDLATSLRNEINEVTNEAAWYNPWKDEGNCPDYSHINEQFETLLQSGHGDVIIDLGKELWKKGNSQVAESHDEGDVVYEIGQCMELVFQAVVSSPTLSRSDQLLWMIDIFLEDEYSIVDECSDFINESVYSQDDWATVAESLQTRLENFPRPKGNSYSKIYRRNNLMNWLLDAFDRCDQEEKILPLLEKEADATQCYEQIVKTYQQQKNFDKAREWCIKGFNKTISSTPGIAGNLQKILRNLADKEKRFDLVAAYRAQDFFRNPTKTTYTDLKQAAERVNCWSDIREKLLNFLETGHHPAQHPTNNKTGTWPLPLPEVEEKVDRRYRAEFPNLSALIDIAILEKRHDDVIILFNTLQQKQRWGTEKGAEVAQAVYKSYPDVALGIWKKMAEGQINLVKPKAYEEAAVYLRKMRKIYEQTKRHQEWQDLILAIRTKHKAKRRLMEVLDSLQKVKIIDSLRKRP